MPDAVRPARLIRFATFEADLENGELRRNGLKLKLSGQPFQVLAILLERPGAVVTREELQKRLWPDTFVDFDHNLNAAINRIREVLGDYAENPRFVETVPKRGYRFIGELQAPIRPVVTAVKVGPDRSPLRRPMWLRIGAGFLAISVIALAVLVAYQWQRRQQPQEQAALTPVPFTAVSGLAASSAFSPDGSRIAFAWGHGTRGLDSFDLYVKALGSETLLRLTQHPSIDLSPAWSPDGTQIAFYRHAGADSGIYIVPALGGPERKLRSTRELRNSTISWSPDGKWIAFLDVPPGEDQPWIHLFSTETSIARRIPINPTCHSEGFPAFSHNGKYLAYWCYQDGWEAVLSFFSLPDGKPKMIAPIPGYPKGLTWSADDKRLLYSTFRGVSSSLELGEVSVSNGSPRRLGFAGIEPAVSPKGDKLAYSSPSFFPNIWRRDLLHSETPAVELIPSSRDQFDAQYSPDGKHIAFASVRSGVQGVWMSNEDGSNLIQISDPSSDPNHGSGSPQWSPDGTKIAFDSFPRDRWEIYVADVAGGKPRKLVTNTSSIIRPNWSRDGKWIYFRSEERGREGIYRCPDSGGDATMLSNDIHGYDPQESFDGKTAYFASYGVDHNSLKKVALSGQSGADSDVDASLRVFRWTMSSNGIYFVPADARRSVRYFEFASKRIRTVLESENDLGSGLSVSPDGRWILYSQGGEPVGDIMLVNDFH